MAENTLAIKKKALKSSGLKKAAAKKLALVKGRAKKAATKKASAKSTSDDYLTKRIMVSAASTGFMRAAARTMSVMGQNVVARNGWVVRVYADGRTERISKIERNNTPLALD